MNIIGEKGLGNYLKIFLEVCFYTSVILLIVMPFILGAFGMSIGASAFVIYPNGIVLLIIAYKFIKLFDSLKQNNPFCENNVKLQKSASKVALIGSFLWLIDLLYELFLAKSDDIIIIATLAFLSVLFLGVSIGLYILSELFKQAKEFKEENELTI